VLHHGKNTPRVKIPSIGPLKEPLIENTIEITVPGRADDIYAIPVTIAPRTKTANKVNRVLTYASELKGRTRHKVMRSGIYTLVSRREIY